MRDLPASHPSDSKYAYHIVFMKEGVDHPQRDHKRIPLPVSKFQLRLYYSLNKKKSPYHTPVGERNVVVYEDCEPTDAIMCGGGISKVTFRLSSPTPSFPDLAIVGMLDDDNLSSERKPEASWIKRVSVTINSTCDPSKVVVLPQS